MFRIRSIGLKTRPALVAALSVLILLFPAFSQAQESVSDASVSGRVVDPSGAALVGARVSARNVDTNQTVAVVADTAGRFRFAHLRVGRYDVSATLAGFDTSMRAVMANAGSAFDLTFVLGMGTLKEADVVVTDPIVETARAEVLATVSRAEISVLPLNGRNFLDVALLAPGVAPANVGGTALIPETSAVPGVGLSIGSQRNFSNNFIVDGLSANDDAAGLSGITYSVDAIDQFQVVTSGGQAELGRALGGYVNVVTKSGTNLVGGGIFAQLRDDRLNAPNVLSGTTLPMRQWQYGATVGGPIVKDRAFYFASVEQRRLDQQGLVTIGLEHATAINKHLAAVGYAGPRVGTGLFDNPFHTMNALAKVDYLAGGSSRVGVRFSDYVASASNARGAGALNAPSASAGLDNHDWAIALSYLFSRGETVLQSQAQVAVSALEALPSDTIGPAVSIAGVAAFGTLSSSPTGRDNHLIQVVNSVTHVRSRNTLRGGVDLLYNDLAITFPRAIRGGYSFGSLAAFMAGTYNNAGFQQTFGDQSVATSNPNLGVYLQDDWRVAARLTVNLGLRYDLQILETIDTDRNNVAPRVGVALRPFDSDRTVVRMNAGMFYDRVPLRALSNALLSADNSTDVSRLRQITIGLSPTQSGAPVFPNTLSAAVSTSALVNLTTMDRAIQNASSTQGSIELEHQLTRGSAVSVAYQRLRGHDLMAAINQNVPTCQAAGANNGCRPNAAYANNSQYSAAGRSTYDALHVSWMLRQNAWASYRLSYAYSKSMNDVGEAFFNGPIDPTDISKDWARSDEDQRHRFVATAALRTSLAPATTWWQHMTRGFQVSGLLQYYSAPPFNITSGMTTIQGTAGRPVVNGAFITRNAGEGAAFMNVAMRLSRSISLGGRRRLELIAEVFNLTNHRNVVTRNTNFGTGEYPGSPSTTFSQVTAVGEPRSAQVGVRLIF